MKKIQKYIWVMVVLAGIFVAAYVALDMKYPSMTIRYKMIVTVETPEGIKTGSAVREVSASAPFIKFPDAGTPTTIKGEAVVVDLGQRGVLFALLGENAKYLVYNAFPYHGGWTSVEGIRHYKKLKNVKAVLAETHYPKFVWFRDINDPKTVENLLEMESDEKYPSTFTIKKDRFAEAFGAGVKLQSVTIEMTDEPVTWGVERWLPWFEQRRTLPGYLGGDTSIPYKDASKTYLTPNSFQEGELK